MPYKPFTVNVYAVETENTTDNQTTEFRDAILDALRQEIEAREIEIREKIRRVNDRSVRDNLIFVNFVTFEYAGPGGVRRAAPVQNLLDQPDQYFAGETAMLYDNELNLVFLESTPTVMGTGAVAEYFEEFANAGTHYRLAPMLDDTAAARARANQVYRSLTLRVSMGPTSDRDREAELGTIKGFGENLGANFIDLVIGVDRARESSLDLGAVRRMIEAVGGNVGEPTSVSKFLVKGREHDDNPLEIIDLFQKGIIYLCTKNPNLT